MERLLNALNTNAIILVSIGVPLAYWLLVVLVRWHKIAVPTRRLACAHLQGLRQRWKQETPAPRRQTAEEQALGERVEHLLEEAERALKPSIWDFLFWPRGAELKAWRLMHEAECLVALHMDEALARRRLEQLLSAIEKAPPPFERFCVRPGGQVEVWAGPLKWNVEFSTMPPLQIRRITAERPDSSSTEEAGNGQPEDIRQRLYWMLRRYYDEKDTNFARLSTAHAKTSWLILVGLGLVSLLLASGSLMGAGTPWRSGEVGGWMLLGATGAFLSRALRMLKSPRLPTDYGVYWILLFLSPVYGALAGIVSVLLVHLAVKLEVLGQTFGVFTLDSDGAPFARLALAALAGLSERWLDRLYQSIEVVVEKAGAKTAAQPTEKETSPQAGKSEGAKPERRPDSPDDPAVTSKKD